MWIAGEEANESDLRNNKYWIQLDILSRNYLKFQVNNVLLHLAVIIPQEPPVKQTIRSDQQVHFATYLVAARENDSTHHQS